LDLQKTWSSKVGNEVRILSMLRALVTMRVANDRPDMDLRAYLHQARIRLGAPDTFDYAGRAIRSACNLHVLRTRRERGEELRKAIQSAKDGSQNIVKGYGQRPAPYQVNTWGEVEADTRLISSGAPLPEFALRDRSSVAGTWDSFREYVLFYNEGWSSWLAWLEFRLFGNAPQITARQWRTVELKLATAGDALWTDPKELNQFFAEALEEVQLADIDHEEIEEQNPEAIVFAANEHGQFDLDRAPRSRGLPSEADPLLIEILETASAVISENVDNSSALLRERVEKYRSALMNLHQASGPAVLIVRGESLRILKQTYDATDDPMDLPPLTERARMRLNELVAQHNVLVGLHDGLAVVDKLIEPNFYEELISPEDLRTIILEGRHKQILTSDAESALTEAARQASSAATGKWLHVIRASESGKNLMRSVLRELLKHKRAIAVTVVSVPPALYAIGHWALANESILMKYFQTNAAMQEAVVRIFEWLHTLPLT
jgi:hypothetical protein